MTKLVKNLIIGGTSTLVVSGAGVGVAIALNKKGKTSADQTVVINHQEEIAQAKIELEQLQAKLNAATTSEELAKVEEEVKAWLAKNTTNINEIGEDVEKQIHEAEQNKEQEIIEANRLQKENAEAGALAAKEAVAQVNKQGNVQSTSNFLDEESKAAQAAFDNAKTTLETPEFDTKTSGQADYEASQQAHVLRVEADREFVESLKESTKEAKAEIKKLAFEVAQAYEAHKSAKLDEKEAIKIARLIKAAELDKEYEAKQAALELRQAVAALNSHAEQEVGTTDAWTPEGQIIAPVFYKTPVLTQEAQDRLQAEDKQFELEQAARELAEATKNAQVQAQPLGSEFGTFTHVDGTVSAPTAIVKPAYKEGVVIPVPKLQVAPMLIPHMVPAIHPQKTPTLVFEVQPIPSLMVTGERGAVVATQEFAFEGAQTLDQFVESLKESTKGLKEEAKQLAFETSKAKDAHKSAKLDAKEAIQAARLIKAAELDKEFEAIQAAKEQQLATLNAKEQTPFSFGTFTNVEGTLTYKWQQPEYVTPSLTPEGQARLQAEDKKYELEQAARELEVATKNAPVQVIPGFGTVVVATGTITTGNEYVTPSLTPEAQARLEQEAKDFAATASQGHNVNERALERQELEQKETEALDAKLAANLKAMEVQSQSPVGIDVKESVDREETSRALAIKADQDRIATEARLEQERIAAEERQRIAIQAELDRLVAQQEAKEAAYAAQFGSSFYSPAYNNFMTGIFTDYERLAKEYELQSVTNENQRWLGNLFATTFSTPVPRAQAMLDQLTKMTGTLDRSQAGFLGQQLVNEIYGRTDVAGIRIAVTNGNIEVRVVGPNGLNPDSVIEAAKIPYTVMPTTVSAGLNPVQSIAIQLADNPQDFKQVVVEQVAQQFKDMIAQTVNGNSINAFGIQNFAYDIMARLANDIKGTDHFHLVAVEENALEHFRVTMQNARVDRNTFIDAMQQAIQLKVREAFQAINMQTLGWRLIGSFGSMDNFLSQIISSIQAMY